MTQKQIVDLASRDIEDLVDSIEVELGRELSESELESVLNESLADFDDDGVDTANDYELQAVLNELQLEYGLTLAEVEKLRTEVTR